MHSYTYHIHDNDIENAHIIPEAFCWKAFIFGIFWLVYKQCYLQALIMFVLFSIINYIGLNILSLDPSFYPFISFIFHLFLGFEAYDLQRHNLESQIYEEKYVILANDSLEAEFKAFQEQQNTLKPAL
jgi:hypothetical protein